MFYASIFLSKYLLKYKSHQISTLFDAMHFFKQKTESLLLRKVKAFTSKQ